MPPPSPKAKMLESLRIPDGEGMPSPYNTTIRYSAKQSFTIMPPFQREMREPPGSRICYGLKFSKIGIQPSPVAVAYSSGVCSVQLTPAIRFMHSRLLGVQQRSR